MRTSARCLAAALVPLLLGQVPASTQGQAEPPGSALTVEQAGPDYRTQGEYVGRLTIEGLDEMFGVQVVAEGDGRFWAVGYRGGLPGAGWDRGDKLRFRGVASGESTVLGPDDERSGYTLAIADKAMTIQDAEGRPVGRLNRVLRRSPTFGLEPPPGATVIFDGTSTEHVLHPDRQPVGMTEDGALILPRGSGGLFTREAFGDCQLHLEFLLPFEPHARGQERANSGCYVQGRYEVQILDSFGLEGRMDECGGMYMNADPLVNAAFPPLSWQTFDIAFTAARYELRDGERVTLSPARMTVHHNGILVHDDQVTQDRETTSAPTPVGPQPERHYLQDHGHTLLLRNIWALRR